MNRWQWIVFGFVLFTIIPLALQWLRFGIYPNTDGAWILLPIATISLVLGVACFICAYFEKEDHKK